MMDKMMNWAIFGAISVIWAVGLTWVLENNSGGDHIGYMFVAVFTVSMSAGKTEGGNAFEHTIDGFKTCATSLIGWAVASVVFMVIYQFTLGDGFNVKGIIDDLILTEISFLTTMMTMSAFNSVRD